MSCDIVHLIAAVRRLTSGLVFEIELKIKKPLGVRGGPAGHFLVSKVEDREADCESVKDGIGRALRLAPPFVGERCKCLCNITTVTMASS